MNSDAINLQLIELKDMIIQLNQTIENQNTLIQKYLEDIAKRDATITDQKALIQYLNDKIYGKSSEKGRVPDAGQVSLFSFLNPNEPDESALVIEQEEIIHVKEHTKKRKAKPTVDERFSNLPERTVVVDTLSEEDKHCILCGTEMVAIGTEVIRTEVIYTPAVLELVEYIATTYECPVCKETEEPYFIKDEGCAPALLPPSYVSPSLAASTFYRKFVMMNETPFQVLKEPGKTPQSKSYIWLARTGEDGLPPIILYHYSTARSGDTAAHILSGMDNLYYMVDGYNGYNKVTGGKRCVCFAHLRRYFLDAIPKGQEADFTLPAVQGVLYCNKLFELQRRYREKGYDYKKRYTRRLKDAKPILEAFLSWIDAQSMSGSSKGNTALTYACNRKADLMTYLEDGRCSMSNNLRENSIRPITVGRKNWLFCDSQDGAYATMTMYTIFEMAKLYHLNQYEYMKYLLEQRPSTDMTDEELLKLAPWSETVQSVCGITK